MSKVFFYKWTGKNTHWNYKLEISKAGTTPIWDNTQTNGLAVGVESVELPCGCLTWNGGEAKFDKIPIGILQTSMDFVVNTEELDLEIYDEFLDAIINPSDYVYNLGETPIYQLWNGTIFRMYCDFKGNTDLESYFYEGYRPVFSGLLKTNLKAYGSSHEIKMNVVDFLRSILESQSYLTKYIVWSMIKILADNMNQECYQGLLELFYSLGDEPITGCANYVIGHPAAGENQKNVFWMYKNSDFWNILNGIYKNLYIQLMREKDNGQTYEMPFPLIQYYKQLYDGTGNLGTAINFGDLYIQGLLCESNTDITTARAGLLYDNDRSGLADRYKNSLWDFFTDVYTEGMTKVIPLAGGVLAFPIFNNSGLVTLSKPDLIDSALDFTQLNIVKVTSSLVDTVESDIVKYEAVAEGGRNGVEFTIPIVFNTMPVSCNYQPEALFVDRENRWLKELHVKPPAFTLTPKDFDLNNIHYSNFYYMAESEYLDQAMMCRVHEWVKFPLGDGLWSDEIPKCSNNPVPRYQWGGLSTVDAMFKPTEICLDIQISNSKPKVLAESLLACFNNNKAAQLAVEADFEVQTAYMGGGSQGFIWWVDGFMNMFGFDCSEIHPKFSYLSQKWVMIDTKLDGEDETATAHFVPKTINL